MSTILISPILTEKSARLSEEGRHYSFRVKQTSNKLEIRQAVLARYPDLDIKEVRTMIVRGKRRRQMTKRGLVKGQRASYKKAIVTLNSGEIDLYGDI